MWLLLKSAFARRWPVQWGRPLRRNLAVAAGSPDVKRSSAARATSGARSVAGSDTDGEFLCWRCPTSLPCNYGEWCSVSRRRKLLRRRLAELGIGDPSLCIAVVCSTWLSARCLRATCLCHGARCLLQRGTGAQDWRLPVMSICRQRMRFFTRVHVHVGSGCAGSDR